MAYGMSNWISSKENPDWWLEAEAPALITYASVVSRDSVQIALTIDALHDLEVKAADIMNA